MYDFNRRIIYDLLRHQNNWCQVLGLETEGKVRLSFWNLYCLTHTTKLLGTTCGWICQSHLKMKAEGYRPPKKTASHYCAFCWIQGCVPSFAWRLAWSVFCTPYPAPKSSESTRKCCKVWGGSLRTWWTSVRPSKKWPTKRIRLQQSSQWDIDAGPHYFACHTSAGVIDWQLGSWSSCFAEVKWRFLMFSAVSRGRRHLKLVPKAYSSIFLLCICFNPLFTPKVYVYWQFVVVP